MTPIAGLSLTELLDAARESFFPEEAQETEREVNSVSTRLFGLRHAVSLAAVTANAAEMRKDATPAHWREAHGELVRLRLALHSAEGEALMLRAELERRVRRVRTGGGK